VRCGVIGSGSVRFGKVIALALESQAGKCNRHFLFYSIMYTIHL